MAHQEMRSQTLCQKYEIGVLFRALQIAEVVPNITYISLTIQFFTPINTPFAHLQHVVGNITGQH